MRKIKEIERPDDSKGKSGALAVLRFDRELGYATFFVRCSAVQVICELENTSFLLAIEMSCQCPGCFGGCTQIVDPLELFADTEEHDGQRIQRHLGSLQEARRYRREIRIGSPPRGCVVSL
jgi:hypothetical protein